jgi:LemA protein
MRMTKIAAAAALALSLTGCGYNQIQQLDERAEQAKSNIGVELTARNQLIPNMVATVKGAAEFERGTNTDVARARAGQRVAAAEAQLNQAQAQTRTAVESRDVAQLQTAEAAQTRAIGTYLNVAVEAYPNLRATQNFQGLQDQLAESENRIAVARRDYISSVQAFNTELRTIPGRWIAAIVYPNAKPMETFTATAGSERPPEVKF